MYYIQAVEGTRLSLLSSAMALVADRGGVEGICFLSFSLIHRELNADFFVFDFNYKHPLRLTGHTDRKRRAYNPTNASSAGTNTTGFPGAYNPCEYRHTGLEIPAWYRFWNLVGL